MNPHTMVHHEVFSAIAEDTAMTELGHDDWVNGIDVDCDDVIRAVQDGDMTIGEAAASVSRDAVWA